LKKVSRKVFLINPKFQLRLIAWMIGMSLAPISVFFAAHYYFFWNLKKLGLDIELEPDHIYFRFLEGQSHKMIIIFLVCSLLTVIIVAILGLLLSHKVAGPIHRLKLHLTQLTKGNSLPELSFRKDDYFQELPQIVNDFIETQDKKNLK
jgi:hypothetical protein